MRFHGKSQEKGKQKRSKHSFSFLYAFRVLHETRLKNEQPLGKLLGDAVRSSVQTLLMIGGFIILFSVINKLLYMMHITEYISFIFQYILHLFQLPKELSIPMISGLFEITLGSQMISQTDKAELLEKAIATSFILAFGGFSVQAQVASILAEANIRFKPFFIARMMHGCFAACFTYVLWKPLYVHPADGNMRVIPAFFIEHSPSWLNHYWQLLHQFGPIITIAFLCLYIWLTTVQWQKSR